jgi:low affinity Fe/Cu permease
MATMPSEVQEKKGFFDKLADRSDAMFSHPAFFAFEIGIVVVWFVTGFFMGFTNDLWHLLINTPTTIITFLLVGLSMNTARRSNAAQHQKLNAIAEGLADLLDEHDTAESHELRAAVGLEEKEAAQDA